MVISLFAIATEQIDGSWYTFQSGEDTIKYAPEKPIEPDTTTVTVNRRAMGRYSVILDSEHASLHRGVSTAETAFAVAIGFMTNPALFEQRVLEQDVGEDGVVGEIVRRVHHNIEDSVVSVEGAIHYEISRCDQPVDSEAVRREYARRYGRSDTSRLDEAIDVIDRVADANQDTDEVFYALLEAKESIEDAQAALQEVEG